jgi:hypothetical protein
MEPRVNLSVPESRRKSSHAKVPVLGHLTVVAVAAQVPSFAVPPVQASGTDIAVASSD